MVKSVAHRGQMLDNKCWASEEQRWSERVARDPHRVPPEEDGQVCGDRCVRVGSNLRGVPRQKLRTDMHSAPTQKNKRAHNIGQAPHPRTTEETTSRNTKETRDTTERFVKKSRRVLPGENTRDIRGTSAEQLDPRLPQSHRSHNRTPRH